MDSGLDSLAAVEFRNRLSNELQGIKLPNTLIFDYPTVAAISNYAVAQLGPATAALGPVSGGSFVASGAFASVMGLAASLPGRRDDGFWEDPHVLPHVFFACCRKSIPIVCCNVCNRSRGLRTWWRRRTLSLRFPSRAGISTSITARIRMHPARRTQSTAASSRVLQLLWGERSATDVTCGIVGCRVLRGI